MQDDVLCWIGNGISINIISFHGNICSGYIWTHLYWVFFLRQSVPPPVHAFLCCTILRTPLGRKTFVIYFVYLSTFASTLATVAQWENLNNQRKFN